MLIITEMPLEPWRYTNHLFTYILTYLLIRYQYRIRCRFPDSAFSSKIACFPHPSLVWRPLTEERSSIST